MATPQQPGPASPRRSRGFSVKSDNSHRTSTSGHKSQKSHSSETHEEKERRNLHTKADPLVAMNELQPMAVALEKSNLGSLRDMQHKDQYGNIISMLFPSPLPTPDPLSQHSPNPLPPTFTAPPNPCIYVIADPDWSNPTRPRSERPLDTIRSFEAAIYGTYNNTRGSYARTEDAASQMGDFSRRTSYYGGGYGRGHEQSNYYGRQSHSRPDSFIDAYQGANQQENYYPYNQQSTNRRPRPAPRMPPDQSGHQQHNHQRSYDNVTAMSGSGTGSGYTESYGHSTDPSSMNSSMDQLQQHALQQQQQQRLDERAQEYGFQFGTAPNLNTKGLPSAPAPVASSTSPMSGAQQQQQQQQPAQAHYAKPANTIRKGANQENRKSWFKRRFSKD
ncbi:hypothetical protein N7532_001880 [Penicillium argentinense]|uniref:Uncharacterized protein n=1 Tax=Penicillium argentinense TaxID=1131581 RepID=A0A9W9KM76_9EURO|nr:uncharacterized protein N7532_001880 [Penicillium argentinense]KAJ5111345.1 hypothetical protein N7532_001880 [Penicillium argentinense]